MTAVLVTRPATVAGTTMEALRQLGYTAWHEPLLTVEPTGNPRPDGTGIQAVMLTSRHALWALRESACETGDLFAMPCFCVGERTAKAARDAGFRQVHASSGGGETLGQLIRERLGISASILHIAGETVATAPQDFLSGKGYTVFSWRIYRAIEAGEFSPALRERLSRRELAAALFYSPRTARVFVRLAAFYKLEACCNGLTAIGLNEAVVSALEALSWRRAIAAGVPAETAMMACLQRYCPVS
jgi:uroporphyrinogen-III synthase